jgi:D-ribose pyranase
VKRIGLLNQPISSVIAGMGHLDTLVIADAGLPISDGPQRIDLAVSAGVPAFLDVLEAVLSELKIESAVLASELETTSAQMHDKLTRVLGDVPVQAVSHDAFKQATRQAKAVIRTGEFTPYANVILIAGVVF